ncbi:MAG TPA: hypothetical protein VD968_19045 [Pyrinomonadaceae bacterium]|nr:hypothetical protein [Pyrinomonadaceae bacterium]
MSKTPTITPESFDALLAWLDPDRERAGEKYEEIRRRLIKIFNARGCPEAERLADLTLDRVTRKVPAVAGDYDGDPALYFYAVANKIFLESLRERKKSEARVPPEAAPTPEKEQRYACLDRCMAKLTPRNRELILEYYRAERREKIDRRRELASGMGVALNALRIRACRIRATLYECVRACMEAEIRNEI